MTLTSKLIYSTSISTFLLLSFSSILFAADGIKPKTPKDLVESCKKKSIEEAYFDYEVQLMRVRSSSRNTISYQCIQVKKHTTSYCPKGYVVNVRRCLKLTTVVIKTLQAALEPKQNSYMTSPYHWAV